jgi:hypothetical protein
LFKNKQRECWEERIHLAISIEQLEFSI